MQVVFLLLINHRPHPQPPPPPDVILSVIISPTTVPIPYNATSPADLGGLYNIVPIITTPRTIRPFLLFIGQTIFNLYKEYIMNEKITFIISSTLPFMLSIGLTRIPYIRPLDRTLVMVSGTTVMNRIITAIISPDLESWKKIQNRYSTQVTTSTSIGIASSILGSLYDGTGLEQSGVNLIFATLGSWGIGNLLWLSDASLLGEKLLLEPKDFVPSIYI